MINNSFQYSVNPREEEAAMKKRLQFIVLFLLVFCFAVTIAVANPTKYGPSVYQEVADRISFDDANQDGIDDNGRKTVHSTTKDGLSGLGQDNKV